MLPNSFIGAGVGKFGVLEGKILITTFLTSHQDIGEADYDKIMNTNVKGVYLWTKAALRSMKTQNKGQIIVMGSNLGTEIRAKASIYCASKFALQVIKKFPSWKVI